ncbi:hypothetical protein V0M98_39470 (plasmid) [Pseudomonas silesiensis]|uniref:hypothetical protein n=1 Tax=Pseudomonas silesiensis TaxID=1853130 RepID=UPI0030CA9B0B
MLNSSFCIPLILPSLPSIIVCSEGQHICPIRKLLKRALLPASAGEAFAAQALAPPAPDGGQQASVKRSLSTGAADLLDSARVYKVDAGVTAAQLDLLPSAAGEQQPAPSALVGSGPTSKVFAAQQLLLGGFWTAFVSPVVAAGVQQPVSAFGSNTFTLA